MAACLEMLILMGSRSAERMDVQMSSVIQMVSSWALSSLMAACLEMLILMGFRSAERMDAQTSLAMQMVSS